MKEESLKKSNKHLEYLYLQEISLAYYFWYAVNKSESLRFGMLRFSLETYTINLLDDYDIWKLFSYVMFIQEVRVKK